MREPATGRPRRIVVIGAGIGGLSAALPLAHAGHQVTVLERHGWVGGKARGVPTVAGPADAGPTVLTMRHVFDAAFEAAGLSLDAHVQLTRAPILARHYWPDGSALDLTGDVETDARSVAALAGAGDGEAFRVFSRQAEALFQTFDAPMMRSRHPVLAGIASGVLRQPGLWPALVPGRTLDGALALRFRDPRLRQLFGRYATYVGGDPARAPALLALIWQAERAGVWQVTGGLHALAEAMAEAVRGRGGVVRTGCGVAEIVTDRNQVRRVKLDDGSEIAADAVVFNGDPKALREGRLGQAVTGAVPAAAVRGRSLSAMVLAFAARPSGLDLAHHTVVFGRPPATEFAQLATGALPDDPTLYICAQDRGGGAVPTGPERFEIIMNAAPLDAATPPDKRDAQTCLTRIFGQLARSGLTFDPLPGPDALTTPQDFATLFPGSDGSLYGPSPHGTLAALRKPKARSRIKGLYLAGGGVHPGAGVPMAALSGRHAADAIAADLASISRFRRTAMRGGMWTGSATTAAAPSRSSVS